MTVRELMHRFLIFAAWCVGMFDLSFAQNAAPSSGLKEMTILQVDPPSSGIPVFTDHPEKAAVIITSSIPSLSFESNMGGIVESRTSMGNGRHVLIVETYTQILSVKAVGYIENRIRIPALKAREVLYFTVEPKAVALSAGRGNLELISEPSGANVQIDGIPDLRVKTPYTFSNYAAQEYVLSIDLEHYDPMYVVVAIRDGESRTEFVELTPKFGYLGLDIRSVSGVEIPGAIVSFPPTAIPTGIQGKDGRRAVLAGAHQVSISAVGHEPKTVQITLEKGQTKTESVQLIPTFGLVQFRVVNSRGERLGQANVGIAESMRQLGISVPNGFDALKVGTHSITITAQGYRSEQLQLVVEPGMERVEEVVLLTPNQAAILPGKLHVFSEPDSRIFVNGTFVGTRQVTLNQNPGTVNIRIEHPYESMSESFFIRPEQDENIFLSPLPKRSMVMLSGVIPGLGHVTTRRTRGWVYMVLAGTSAAYGVLSWGRYSDWAIIAQQRYDLYSGTLDENVIVQRGDLLEQSITRRDQFYSSSTRSLLLAAGTLVISYLDLIAFKPSHGYQSKVELALVDYSKTSPASSGFLSANNKSAPGTDRFEFYTGTASGHRDHADFGMGIGTASGSGYGPGVGTVFKPGIGSGVGLAARISF